MIYVDQIYCPINKGTQVCNNTRVPLLIYTNQI